MTDECEICNEDMGYSGTNCALSSTLKGVLCFECLKKPEVNSKLVIPVVTELENDVIMNGIVKSELFEKYKNGMVWTNLLINNCKITSREQLPGVVSSLVKKGFISSEGANEDATVQLTAEGYWYYLNNPAIGRYPMYEEVKCVSCSAVVTSPNFNGIISSTLKGELCYPCIEKNLENPDSTDFTLIIPNVTELENDVIMNGIGKHDQFTFECIEGVPNGIIPSEQVIENCKITTSTQIPGVVSSLVKKGMIIQTGKGKGASVQLTAEGFSYYLSKV